MHAVHACRPLQTLWAVGGCGVMSAACCFRIVLVTIILLHVLFQTARGGFDSAALLEQHVAVCNSSAWLGRQNSGVLPAPGAASNAHM